jgi:hypothetical protein
MDKKAGRKADVHDDSITEIVMAPKPFKHVY